MYLDQVVEFVLMLNLFHLKKDMIGKKDVSNTLNIGIEQIMHMTYECAEFERITRLNDIEAYEKLCDQTRLVVSILEQCSKGE